MTMTLVETITVGSGGAASIEFTGIPGDGKDFMVLLSSRNTYTAAETSFIETRINGLTSGYTNLYLLGNGSVVSSGYFGTATWRIQYQNSNSSTANTFGNCKMYFSNYSSSSAKSASTDTVSENNATAARQLIGAHSHTTTSAITSLEMFQSSFDFMEHSTASLYIIS